MDVRCALCNEPISPNDPKAYQRVEGWEKKRAGGGANQITLRTVVGGLAHGLCVDKVRKHILVGQESML